MVNVNVKLNPLFLENVSIKSVTLAENEENKYHQFALTFQNSCANKNWNTVMASVWSKQIMYHIY